VPGRDTYRQRELRGEMVKENNRGFVAGISQRSQAQQVFWALTGAPMRNKDLRLDALSGVAEGRKLRDRMTAPMIKRGIDPEDCIVLCVFAEPDLSEIVPELLYLPVKDKGIQATFKDIERHVDKLPIGFLVAVRDTTNPQKPIYGHARPLIVEDPRGPLLNDMALLNYTAQIEAKMKSAGLIPSTEN
jgi:hypothetical protein